MISVQMSYNSRNVTLVLFFMGAIWVKLTAWKPEKFFHPLVKKAEKNSYNFYVKTHFNLLLILSQFAKTTMKHC